MPSTLNTPEVATVLDRCTRLQKLKRSQPSNESTPARPNRERDSARLSDIACRGSNKADFLGSNSNSETSVLAG
jgi:hypothetical protein